MKSFIEKNVMLEKLHAGGVSVGVQIRSRSPMVAEIAGLCGYDFLYVETEHFACNDETMENLARSAHGAGIAPIIRVTSNDPEYLMHILDLGMMGVIVPHVESAEEAKRMVESLKYPPVGCRGASFGSRAAGYGLTGREEYRQQANENTAVIFMIESVKAVENLEGILDSGVDIIRIGRNDLSEDMGLKGKKNDPAFLQTEDYIIQKATERGIPVGMAARSIDDLVTAVKRGFRQISFGSDLDVISKQWKSDYDIINEKLAELK